jgi:hypothetical protein
MVDYPTCINVRQRFKCQTPTFFFLFDPGGQSLLDDPSTRSFEARRHFVHLFGQGKRHMSGEHFRFHPNLAYSLNHSD